MVESPPGADISKMDEKEKQEFPRPQTRGEFLVGIKFNPTKSNLVYQIKSKAAELIDLLKAIPLTPEDQQGSEAVYKDRQRLHGLAEKCFEEGAMWAVKKATKKL